MDLEKQGNEPERLRQQARPFWRAPILTDHDVVESTELQAGAFSNDAAFALVS